jgi:hypothetical protein
MKIGPKEKREARAFLYRRGIRSDMVNPEKFAKAKRETGAKFETLLGAIKAFYRGGQGEGPFPRMKKLLTKEQ